MWVQMASELRTARAVFCQAACMQLTFAYIKVMFIAVVWGDACMRNVYMFMCQRLLWSCAKDPLMEYGIVDASRRPYRQHETTSQLLCSFAGAWRVPSLP